MLLYSWSLNHCRALSETHQNKKSSLKPLVECFLRRKDGEGSAGGEVLNGQDAMMIVPPLMVGHTLSHEQVMPFLKKLEQGQLREGGCMLGGCVDVGVWVWVGCVCVCGCGGVGGMCVYVCGWDVCVGVCVCE